MQPPLRLGLTGGIGSGKSSVAGFLAEFGAHCIDLDAVSRCLTAAGGAALEPIVATFGASMLNQHGALDRHQMRELVFSDARARQQLQAIMHPLIDEQVQRWQDALMLSKPRCLVFEVPLLVESSYWRHRLDMVLVVDCSVATQLERVMSRSHLSAAAAQAIIDAQAPRLQRLRASDAVIFNDGISLADLRWQAAAMALSCGLSSALAAY